MLCLWSRRGVWGNSDAELAVKQEAPHFNEGRSHRVNDEDRRRDRPDLRRLAQGLRDHLLVHHRDRRRQGRREADRNDDDDADSQSKPALKRQRPLPVMCVSFPYVFACLKHRRYRLL